MDNFQITVITEKGRVQVTNLSGYLGETIADRTVSEAVKDGARYAAVFVYDEMGMLDYIRGESFAGAREGS